VDALCSTPSELSFGGYSHADPANIAGNRSEQIPSVPTVVNSTSALQVFKAVAATSTDYGQSLPDVQRHKVKALSPVPLVFRGEELFERDYTNVQSIARRDTHSES